MPLWLIDKLSKSYGEYDALVVRADTQELAREVAIEHVKKTGAWNNPDQIRTCSCVAIEASGPDGVILSSLIDG